MELLHNSWPWYVAGPLIGLLVPALLLLSGKAFGISSSFRHICAACIPSKVPFFNYDWKQERWNLVFVLGVLAGAFISASLLTPDPQVAIAETTRSDLEALGVSEFSTLAPLDLFHFGSLLTLKGFVLIVVGGFLVGFGTRYAGGCTSGHSIMGMANLQWPSLVATICFFIGGLLSTHLLLPFILNW